MRRSLADALDRLQNLKCGLALRKMLRHVAQLLPPEQSILTLITHDQLLTTHSLHRMDSFHS
jgi:hypothetical protein